MNAILPRLTATAVASARVRAGAVSMAAVTGEPGPLVAVLTSCGGQQGENGQQQDGAEGDPRGGRQGPGPGTAGDQRGCPAGAGHWAGRQHLPGGAPARCLAGELAGHGREVAELGQRGARGFLVTGVGGEVVLVGLEQAGGCLLGDRRG